MSDNEQTKPNSDTAEGLSRRALIGGAAAGGLALAAGVLVHGATAADAAPLGAITRASLTVDGVEIASFPELVSLTVAIQVTSFTDGGGGGTIFLPGAALAPKVVLQRPLDSDIQMWAWHEAARTGSPSGRKSCTVTLFRANTPVAKFFLRNAFPNSLDLTDADRGSALMETVTMTCEFIQRVSV